MPSDVTGTNILVTSADGARHFSLHKGPIFGQVILADEINRATPKTQSSLLEAMQEHACTIAGTRHAMEEPFFVLATENPIEMEGTYPLPEAQLDRFLLKVIVPSPTEDEMTEILTRTTGRDRGEPPRVLSREELLVLRALCRDVAVAEPVLRYASRFVRASDPRRRARPISSSARCASGPACAGRSRWSWPRRPWPCSMGAPTSRSPTSSASPGPCCATGSSARSRARPTGSRRTRSSRSLIEAVATRPEAVQQAMAR